MIRAIVENRYSRRDVNGNVYWVSRVTNTFDGESIVFTTPHSSNTLALIRNAGLEWNDIYQYDIETPIRRFNQIEKTVKMHNTCMSETVLNNIITVLGLPPHIHRWRTSEYSGTRCLDCDARKG